MKKILAVLLALSLTFALCACGGEAGSGSTEAPKIEYPEGVTDMAYGEGGYEFSYNGNPILQESICSAYADLPDWTVEEFVNSIGETGRKVFLSITEEAGYPTSELLVVVLPKHYGFETMPEMLDFANTVFALMKTDPSIVVPDTDNSSTASADTTSFKADNALAPLEKANAAAASFEYNPFKPFLRNMVDLSIVVGTAINA